MALIRVHKSFLVEKDTFDIIVDTFDRMEKIKEENDVTVFRVCHEEVPNEDIVICPAFYTFEGVRPFIIEWD